ncbi:MAG: hypothetical protein WB729_09795 [Candidatus Sulfotelmatobacter sp.]
MLLASLVPLDAAAVTKPHLIALGKWTAVSWTSGIENNKPQTLKVRALIVDGRAREYILGTPHEITDRLFVARRAFRVNDSLPDETNPRWLWQRGGWLLVDRLSGRISALNLPEFDAFYSAASWYRDYVAYCGVSDDGKKYVIVAQMSRRKPVVKKLLAGENIAEDAAPDSACDAPVWQRTPVQVSFQPPDGAKQTYAVRGHIVDVVVDDEGDAEASK